MRNDDNTKFKVWSTYFTGGSSLTRGRAMYLDLSLRSPSLNLISSIWIDQSFFSCFARFACVWDAGLTKSAMQICFRNERICIMPQMLKSNWELDVIAVRIVIRLCIGFCHVLITVRWTTASGKFRLIRQIGHTQSVDECLGFLPQKILGEFVERVPCVRVVVEVLRVADGWVTTLSILTYITHIESDSWMSWGRSREEMTGSDWAASWIATAHPDAFEQFLSWCRRCVFGRDVTLVRLRRSSGVYSSASERARRRSLPWFVANH